MNSRKGKRGHRERRGSNLWYARAPRKIAPLPLRDNGPGLKLQCGALRHLPPGGMGELSTRLQEAVRDAARDPDRRVRAAEETLQRFESGAAA